jgi:hypothetical protein
MAYNDAMRFEVPQFIEIEDKIFGPFTWKQFVYLGGGVGLAVVIFFTLPLIVFVLIGVPIGGLAVLLAFYPVNNRPFSIFLESIVFFYKNSRVYHWRKKSNIIYKDRSNERIESSEPRYQIAEGSSINSLSRKLEIAALQKEQ